MSELFGVNVFSELKVVAAAETFDIRPVSAIDNHDAVAKIFDNGFEFCFVEGVGGGEVDRIWVMVFNGNVIFAGFEIRTKRARGGDDFCAVFGASERTRKSGHGELR